MTESRSSVNPSWSSSRQEASRATNEPDQQQVVQAVGVFFAVVAVLRILTSPLYLFIFGPIIYFYMLQTCPSEQLFDVRKELKRVMRGHHLPDDHPDKPKGFLKETLARAVASLTTEVATSLGYDVTVYNFQRIAILIWVRVPAAKMDYYWIGALSRWTYVYSSEIPDAKAKAD